MQIGSRFGLHNRGTANRGNVKESDSVEEIIGKDLHKGLTNSGNTSEDLAALDRLITYLLSPNPTNSNLDSWRRSHRASSRGYRQLRGTTADIAETGGVGTTLL